MRLEKLEEVDERIRKVEEYRHHLKWASRDPESWPMPGDEESKKMILKC